MLVFGWLASGNFEDRSPGGIVTSRALIVGLTALVAAALHLGAASSAPFPGLKPLEEARTAEDGRHLRVHYLGISTLLISDGETQLLVDGFISRPDRGDVFVHGIQPDTIEVDTRLSQIGAGRVAAVLTAHAHYDHALDAAYIAKVKHAKLVGSPSVANIGRGARVPPVDLWQPKNGEAFTCGRFQVTVLHGPHALGNFYNGAIGKPVTPPVPTSRYRAADSYAYLIENRGRRILVQPSANLPTKLAVSPKADVIFLSLGMLGWRSEEFVQQYWTTLVDEGANGEAGRTQVVVPIHWDDPTQRLSAGLQPAPFPDRVDRGLELIRKQDKRGLLREMPLLKPVDFDLPMTADPPGASPPAQGCTWIKPRN